MNNAKIWLVVKPTVGLPLMLGAVALGSLFVHYQMLSNTTWLPKYYEGKGAASASLDAPATTVGSNAVVLFNGAAAGTQEAMVVLPDGRTGKVTFPSGATTTAAVEGGGALPAQ